jgi:hypothetical protein
MLSVTYIIQRPMISWLLKEAVVACFEMLFQRLLGGSLESHDINIIGLGV